MKEHFHHKISEYLMRFAPRDRVVVMNMRVYDEPIEGAVAPLGVPGVNANGECLMEICHEKGMIVGNT